MPKTTAMQLDARFGIAIDPQPGIGNPNGIRDWELEYSPVSLATLDDFAGYLVALTEIDVEGPVLRMIFRQVNILWVIDEAGTIHVALEELAPTDTLVQPGGEYVYFPRKLQFLGRPKKLGHPSLLNRMKGRIAGEIILEVNDSGKYEWQINNNSGRYSHNMNRTKEQLLEVAREFEKRNVNLKVQHYDR